MYETILVEKKERVATITLNRPDKMNAITPQLQTELIRSLKEMDAADDIGVIVLTGAGRAFCAGFDVPTMRDTPEVFTRDDLLTVIALNKPIIVAVNGYALAQGFQLALACDIIVASEKAIFGSIGARIGELCTYAVFALPRVVGRNKAAEMLFTCDHISGEEAFRIGLATKVVPPEELMAATRELADRMKNKAPLVLKYSRQALREGEFSGEALDWVTEVSRELNKTEDKKEAFAAIVEKREPVFRGR